MLLLGKGKENMKEKENRDEGESLSLIMFDINPVLQSFQLCKDRNWDF